MPARPQEIALGIGFHKQSALQTALAAASLWSLNTNAFNVPFPNLAFETDAQDYGKGHEFVENVFPLQSELSWEWPYYLTSEHWCQAIVFSGGDTTKTSPDTGAYKYTCTLIDPVTDGLELPATTLVAAIRQAGTPLLNVANVGMVCAGWTLRVTSQLGRASCELISRWIGCGKILTTSVPVIPAAETVHSLNSGTLGTLTILGTNYLSDDRFVQFEFTLDNGLRPQYKPGGGVDAAGYSLAKAIRIGDRSLTFNMIAELESDSAELAALQAGTEGTIVADLQGTTIAGTTKHQAKITAQRVQLASYVLGETDGFVTVSAGTVFKKHSTNGVVELIGICEKDEIGEAA